MLGKSAIRPAAMAAAHENLPPHHHMFEALRAADGFTEKCKKLTTKLPRGEVGGYEKPRWVFAPGGGVAMTVENGELAT